MTIVTNVCLTNATELTTVALSSRKWMDDISTLSAANLTAYTSPLYVFLCNQMTNTTDFLGHVHHHFGSLSIFETELRNARYSIPNLFHSILFEDCDVFCHLFTLKISYYMKDLFLLLRICWYCQQTNEYAAICLWYLCFSVRAKCKMHSEC